MILGRPSKYRSAKARNKNREPKLAGSFLAVGLLAFLGVCLASASYDQVTDHWMAVGILLITGMASIAGIVRSMARQTSMHLLSFFFCYMFMSAAPIVQIGADLDPVFKRDDILIAAAVCGLAFTLIGWLSILPRWEMSREPECAAGASGGKAVALLPLFIVTTTVGIVTAALFRDGLFSSREGIGIALGSVFGDPQLAIVLGTLMFSLPFYGSVIGFCAARDAGSKGWSCLFALPFVISMVLNNPSVHPRFKLAGLLFFFIDYVFKGRRTKLLVITLAIGTLVAPLFNVFRYENTNKSNALESAVPAFERTLMSYDYDAFQLTNYSILKVERDGLTWGANILGAALTFIPRSWWPDKPETSAHVVFETMKKLREVGTNNLSTPLMAEGYLAFGWPGVLLISWLYWRALFLLNRKACLDPGGLAFLLRSVAAGLVLIFLRGTLAVAVSAVEGAFVAAIVPWLLLSRKESGAKRARSANALSRSIPQDGRHRHDAS